jgi:hypothetical protein
MSRQTAQDVLNFWFAGLWDTAMDDMDALSALNPLWCL